MKREYFKKFPQLPLSHVYSTCLIHLILLIGGCWVNMSKSHHRFMNRISSNHPIITVTQMYPKAL